MLATLMLATLAAAIAVGVFLLIRHMRKPENRHPMEGQRDRNIVEMQRERDQGR